MRPQHPEGHLSPNAIRPTTRAVVAACLTLGALGSTASVALGQAAEPDGWPQFQGDPGHSGSRAEGPQPPFRERWRLPAPAGDSLSPPIVVGDLAVTLGSEAVYGVDLATGSVAWEVPRGGGPLSSPAAVPIEGGTALLYLEGPADDAGTGPSPSATASPTASPGGGTGAGGDGSSSLVAISLEDRAELWRTELEGLARSGVTVDDTTAYVGEHGGRVVAVSLQDGGITWTAELPGRVDTPVAVAGGSVFAVARDADEGRVAVAALDAASGECAWEPGPESELPCGVRIGAASTVSSGPAAGEGFVLIGSADRLVRSIAAEDGSERWAALVLSFFSPATAPAFSTQAAFAADLSGGLYRFDLADGDRAWSHQLNDVVLRSSPVVSGSTILLGLNDGRLVAIDAGSGHLVWESEPTPGLVGTIALGPGVVVAVKGGAEGGLIAFEPDPERSLVDVPSPTELDAGTTLARYGVAAVIVVVVVLVPGVALRRRFGAADLSGGSEEGEVEDEGDEGEEP